MITRLIWTIWTSLSAVTRKAVKFNYSLTHCWLNGNTVYLLYFIAALSKQNFGNKIQNKYAINLYCVVPEEKYIGLGLTEAYIVLLDGWWFCTSCTGINLHLNQEKFNSSSPGKNPRHFSNDIFKCIFMNEKFCFLVPISLKFVANGPKSALVLAMAWRRKGDNPLSESILM